MASRLSMTRRLSPAGDLVYVTSGDDRVLALDRNGNVILDSGRIKGMDAGGGAFAPDGRYCVTLRRRGTTVAPPARLDSEGEPLLPVGAAPFPRGFGFGDGGQLYLSSGIGPSGEDDNTITMFDHDGRLRNPRPVSEPELSPLDLAIAPGGNLVVSSEWPFGSPSARVTIRESHARRDLARSAVQRVAGIENLIVLEIRRLLPSLRWLIS
jgi:DNA-binding beta-propeller fold protein YncE